MDLGDALPGVLVWLLVFAWFGWRDLELERAIRRHFRGDK